MAYSFAPSGENSNTEPKPDYLDFGFAWLNDYDKAGNYIRNRDDLRETRQENPYGWNASAPRNRGIGDPRQSSEADLRQTGEAGRRQKSGSDFRQTRGVDLRLTAGNDFQQIDENDISSDLRGTNRDDLRQTHRYDHGYTNRDNLGQTNSIGLRNTRVNYHTETMQLDNIAVTQKENPYGWNALGPTRRVTASTTQMEDIPNSNNLDKTVKENPYGWKALGPTRRPPSQNSDGSTIRISRKRTYQTSFARRSSRESRGDQPNFIPSEGRVIKHANRLSALPEEVVRNGNKARGGDLRSSTVDAPALRYTTGGGGLRGTTYEYARNIIREPTLDPGARERANTLIPERTQVNWASVHTPDDGPKLWTDIATDKSLMSKWYETFAKIKRRWAANYGDPSLLSGLSEGTVSRPVEFKRRSRKTVNGRLKLALISAVVLFVLLVAAGVPVAIFTTGSSGKEAAEEKLWLYDLQASINRSFTGEMSDNSSQAFRNISEPFCDLIDVNFNNSSFNYNGCLVTSLSDGSIVVNFVVVLRATEGNAPSIIDLLVVINLQNENQLGPFQFSRPLVVLSRRIIAETDNPLPEVKQFNETCSSGNECKSYFSNCINSTCMCPDNRFYENSSDTCLPIYCGDIAEIANGTFNITGNYYGDMLTIECDIGYELSEHNTIVCTTEQSWKSLPTCSIIQCEDFLIPEHAGIDSETTQNKTFLEEIIISCEEGFELDGGNKTFCQFDKTWSNNPNCKPVNCTEPDLPENVLTTAENISFVFESVIELECSDGYILHGERNISCLANKIWTEFPTCTPVQCSPVQLPENAVEQGNTTDKLFGEEIVIQCSAGYTKNGTETIVCHTNGSWSVIPECIQVTCPAFDQPKNSFTPDFNESAIFEYSDTLMILCENGYYISGTENVTCQEDGTWSKYPKCKPVNCTEPDLPENILPTAENNSFVFESVIELECSAGYTLNGERNISCLANKTWTEFPTCTPVPCPTLQFPENAVEQGNITDRVFGEEIVIQCSAGYTIDGTETIVCQPNGSWSAIPECIPVTCPAFDQPKNSFTPNFNESVSFEYSDIVMIECETGYYISGSENVTCQEDGTWSNYPKCEPVNCTEPDLPEHVLKTAENNSFVFESVIELECSAGYILNGESKITCLANKTWTEFPMCTPVPCPTLQFPENAVEQENVTEKVFGDEVIIECLVGYNISGNEAVECLEDGTWSGSPTCTIIDCGDLEEPVNGKIEYAEGTHFNMTQKVSCNEGYKLNIGSEDTVTCTRSGNWSSIPECELKMCSYPNSIQHGKFVGNITTNIYSELMIECIAGFDLIGNNSVTCTTNETWSELPICKPVECGDPPLVLNGQNVMINETTFNASFSVKCLDGYELNGSISVMCESTGNWSALPLCSARDCGMPTWNASILSSTGTRFGDVIELGCEEGFDSIGNSTTVCQGNGTWSEFPVCRIKDCGDIEEMENGRVSYENGTTFKSVASIECNDTYDRIGDANVKCLADGNWEPLPFCTETNCGGFIPPENSLVEKENQSVECYEGYELIGESKLICLNNSLTFNGTCEPFTCLLPNVSDHLLTSYDNVMEYTFGKQISIYCEDGFSLEVDEDVLTCQANGKWSASPSCIPTHCPIPELLPNVVMVNSSKDLFDFNETIDIRCRSGFILQGVDMLSCFQDGTWLGSANCIPINCSLRDISDNFNKSNILEDKFSVNASVILNCNSGFTIHGNETIVCQPNGNWSAIPECIPVSCPIFDQPENSLIADFNESAKFQYSDTVMIECETGYNISGNENVTCQADKTWTTIPECSKVRCDMYTLENGRTGNQTFYSEVLEIECDIGYERSSNDSVICNENGQWSSNPTCELVDCKEVTLPEHSFVVNNVSSTLFNTTLEVSCKTGYILANEEEAFVTCEADGNWTGNPECEIKPAINFVETAVTAQIGSTTELQCVLVGNLPTLDVVIARNSTVQGEQLVCNVSQTGAVNCSVPGITGNGLKNGDNMTVTITVDQVLCEDEGIYYCASVSNNSLNAAFNLSVTKPPGEPLLSLPVRMVADLLEESQTISCTADVGYPAGELRIEYRSDNSTLFDTFDLGTNNRAGSRSGCSVNKNITFKDYTFTQFWNNTDIRCAVYTNTEDDNPIEVSDIAKIQLITNDCPSEGSLYKYHPLNCHYYIFCIGGFIDVNSCGANCPDIQNGTSLESCNGNCTYLGC